MGLVGDWSSVHAKLGDRGFVGEVWPDVLSIDLPNINQPWQPA